jgi:universal stress protein A
MKTAIGLNRILVPVDFSIESRRALEHAAMLAVRFGAQIRLLHVVPPLLVEADYGYGTVTRHVPNDRLVKHAMTRLKAARKTKLSVTANVEEEVRTGSPHDEIVKAAKDLECGLIIMGTHGRARLQNMPVGSTAENVIRTAHCPVLIVRKKESDSFRKTSFAKPKLQYQR